MKMIPAIIAVVLVTLGGAYLAVAVFGEGAIAAYVAAALITIALLWMIKNEK